MTSFAEKRCVSSLSSWFVVDTLLISKLFTPLVPICSQFRLYICPHRFQCLSTNDVIIKRVYSTNATKRKISLLGSQAVKLMSQRQIAAIGEDLQYFLHRLISRHGGQKSKLALTRDQFPMPWHCPLMFKVTSGRNVLPWLRYLVPPPIYF